MTVRVTVIIPTYNTGVALGRLVDSLDAQTLPTDQFEAVFVDDGSTDVTAHRLEVLCTNRPNYRTARIPHSGWPGRPRNVGLDLARGEYVFFCDHDDYLAPDALERMHNYAVQNGSDIVIGREIRVGRRPMSNALFRTNRPRVDLSWPPLLHLLTPHKLFRRGFLADHDLRFPEGKRRLEDHAFVLSAYFLASTISVLADTPCYFWVMTAAEGTVHASRGIQPDIYYRDLEEILDIVEANTEPGPHRDRLLSHWYRGKVLGFIGRGVGRGEPERLEALLHISSELARTRFADVDPYLTPVQRVQSALLRAGHLDALMALAASIDQLTATPVVVAATWQHDTLVIEVTTALHSADGAPVLFRRLGERVHWAPTVSLGEGIDARLLDLTDAVSAPQAVLLLREPNSGVHHEVPGQVETELVPVKGGHSLTTTATFRVSPHTLADGRALPAGVWRARLTTGVGGLTSAEDLPTPNPAPAPALLAGTPVVPFRRRNGAFALAVSTRSHPLVAASRVRPQDVTVLHTANGWRLRIQLPGVHPHGETALPAALHVGELPSTARLVCDGRTTYVESWLSALPGQHRLTLAIDSGKPVDLAIVLQVAGDGTVTSRRAPHPAAAPLSHRAMRSAIRRVPGLVTGQRWSQRAVHAGLRRLHGRSRT